MNEEIPAAERRAVELLREHDPASSVRPGAAARVEARLHRPAKKPRYVWALILAAIAISTASFAARALFRAAPALPQPVTAPVAQAVVEPVAPPAPPRSSLLEEAGLLEQGAQELKNGRVPEALAGVDGYEKKFPSGVLRTEALGFRVQAFEQLGADKLTPAMAEQWVAALAGLGRCADATRLAQHAAPAQREGFGRALKGFCSP